jgi:hypothetical protein
LALGINPALGRLFLPGEGEKPGEQTLVVLGYSYWQKRFGGNRGVLGKQVLVNGKPAVVIGVTPQGFQFWTDAGSSSIHRAQRAVDVVAARTAAQYAETDKEGYLRVIPEYMARPAPLVAISPAGSGRGGR